MLKLRHVTLQRGGKPLLDDTSLIIHRGQKIGVVGANGSGKSSLFAMIQGELQADTGDLDLPAGLTLAHVAQQTPALADPAIDYVLTGDQELCHVERQLRIAEAADDGEQTALWHARYASIDGYTARARAARLLAGLGFANQQLEQPVAEFSGGWRMRLNLARALICRSDLLLLDEPTNHLDLDAVIWLEQWLRAYPETLLLISHDRDFLDNVIDGIVHIERRGAQLYRGNYSAFENQRVARLINHQAAYQKQQKEIDQLQGFIDRFRAKATKARQAQSRLKVLQRMEKLAPAHADSPFVFRLPEPEKLPNPLLQLEQVAVGYGDQPVLEQVSLSLQPGMRIGLLGLNGAGKSTLIKLLAGSLSIDNGRYLPAQDLRVGYFAQHQLEQLQLDSSPLQHLQQLSPDLSEQAARNYLGGFGFPSEQALIPVAPFSGGEKARLALALIIWQRPNLLLLDEPTNHLDLEMRRALTLALQPYPGTIVVVSHDRHLLRSSCDEYWLVHDGRVQPFKGDLDDYRQWLAALSSSASAGNEPRSTSTAERRQQKRAKAEQRNQLASKRRPLEQQLRNLEKQLDQLNTQQTKIELSLSDQAIYDTDNKNQLKELLLQQGNTRRELSQVEEKWLLLQEQIEALVNSINT